MSTNTAQAAPRDFVAEHARVKADEAVSRALRSGLEVPRLLADTTQERERLLFRLRSLRSAYEKRCAAQEKMSERGSINAPHSLSPEHAKAERRLIHLEAMLGALHDKAEDDVKARAEGQTLAAMQNAGAEQARLLAVFRQEEAEKAAGEEYDRFLKWKEDLGL